MDVADGEGHLDAIGDRVAGGEHQGSGAQDLAVARHHRLGIADVGHAHGNTAAVADLAVGVQEQA